MLSLMNTRLLLASLALSAALFTACSRKSKTATTQAPPEAPAAAEPAPAGNDASAAPPPPGSAPVEKAAPAKTDADDSGIKYTELEKIKYALQAFTLAFERPPKDLNELVARKYLARLPAAPEGKKFVYNPARSEVKIENK